MARLRLISLLVGTCLLFSVAAGSFMCPLILIICDKPGCYMDYTTNRCGSCKCEGGPPSEDICSLPKAPGPCDAIMPRYFFNTETGKCERFVYGGCEGNANNFNTIEECQMRCPGGKPSEPPTGDICLLPPDKGPCKARLRRWYFNSRRNRCQTFTYGGCEGNDNRFDSFEECEETCSRGGNEPPPTDICSLPKQPGPCKAYIPSYFFNSETGRCERFIYGGCLGNANRFETKAECKRECPEKTEPANICWLPADPGRCYGYSIRYFFNWRTWRCERFVYGLCGGNANNFKRKEDCEATCPWGGEDGTMYAKPS